MSNIAIRQLQNVNDFYATFAYQRVSLCLLGQCHSIFQVLVQIITINLFIASCDFSINRSVYLVREQNVSNYKIQLQLNDSLKLLSYL